MLANQPSESFPGPFTLHKLSGQPEINRRAQHNIVSGRRKAVSAFVLVFANFENIEAKNYLQFLLNALVFNKFTNSCVLPSSERPNGSSQTLKYEQRLKRKRKSRRMLKRSSLKHSQSAVLWEHHNEEVKRLVEDKNRQANWREWGPYLSDRQWGTVREDYSHDGNWQVRIDNYPGLINLICCHILQYINMHNKTNISSTAGYEPNNKKF